MEISKPENVDQSFPKGALRASERDTDDRGLRAAGVRVGGWHWVVSSTGQAGPFASVGKVYSGA